MTPAESPVNGSSRTERGAESRPERFGPARTEVEPGAETSERVVEPDQPVPSEQDLANARDRGVRRQGIKLAVAAALATFFGALYLEHGNGLFLAGASTALALIAYWIAEHELGRVGDR